MRAEPSTSYSLQSSDQFNPEPIVYDSIKHTFILFKHHTGSHSFVRHNRRIDLDSTYLSSGPFKLAVNWAASIFWVPDLFGWLYHL
ncbi:hypothetical protein ACJZ2D_005644 [Fusarium nematophilum]